VYFRITHPDWGETPRDRPIPILNQGQAFLTLVDTINLVITGAILFFAGRNVKLGRADVRGAMVLGGTMVVLQYSSWIFAGGHFPRFGVVFPLWVNETASVLFLGGLSAICFLALEPVIRRRCPYRLTAWTRLTTGKWRDPLVGRDVVLGMLVGIATTVDMPAMPFFPSRWGPSVVHPYSFTRPLGEVASQAISALGGCWLYAGLFAVLLVMARREWIATTVLTALLLFNSLAGTGFPLVNQVFQVVRVAAGVFLLLRFGILATVACVFASLLLQTGPLSLDTSAWYFSASLTCLVALVGLSGYAAWISVGSRWSEKARIFADD
jgi:serine/threonine-protein kinase